VLARLRRARQGEVSQQRELLARVEGDRPLAPAHQRRPQHRHREGRSLAKRTASPRLHDALQHPIQGPLGSQALARPVQRLQTGAHQRLAVMQLRLGDGDAGQGCERREGLRIIGHGPRRRIVEPERPHDSTQ
jgi:hypothetical protein